MDSSGDSFLNFTPDGQFYSYFVTFPASAFAATQNALVARLGKPSSDKPSIVENRMGAKFDQETLEWSTPHTHVKLTQRFPGDLTLGLLEVLYTPLEKNIPPEPTATAPF